MKKILTVKGTSADADAPAAPLGNDDGASDTATRGEFFTRPQSHALLSISCNHICLTSL